MDPCDKLIIGQSQSLKNIKGLIHKVANSDLNVIIYGETGVGKELVAQALHLLSDRKDKPLVKVNCAAVPSELLESELFGYEKGAFTGADRPKAGKFELAHEGTILLDEIGDMPIPLQAKMLQVLQDLRFSRLGGKTDVEVDCWVLTATNQDLEERMSAGLFREDLYYRLNIIKIYVPPLRERPVDIEALIHHFTEQYVRKTGEPPYEFTDDAVLEFLYQYSWPGNVRELKNTIERLMLLGDWEAVKEELMEREGKAVGGPEETVATPPSSASDTETVQKKQFPSLKEVKNKAIREAEKKLIGAVLEETRWHRKNASRILNISYKALLYKIKEYDLQPDN